MSEKSNEEWYWIVGGKKPVPHLTEAAIKFASEHSRLLDFYVFFDSAAIGTLNSLTEDAKRKTVLEERTRNEELLIEIVICRVVDNFLSFLSDLLSCIYKARPEMLRSSEQERVDFVLQFETMDKLRRALAEKRVERLAYLGLRDLAEHLKSQMQLSLFISQDELEQAAILVEYRNLFVHNRGVVSAVSGRRFKKLRDAVGKRIVLSSSDVRNLRKFLENAVIDLDLRATEKFGLPVIPLSEPPSDLVG